MRHCLVVLNRHVDWEIGVPTRPDGGAPITRVLAHTFLKKQVFYTAIPNITFPQPCNTIVWFYLSNLQFLTQVVKLLVIRIRIRTRVSSFSGLCNGW